MLSECHLTRHSFARFCSPISPISYMCYRYIMHPSNYSDGALGLLSGVLHLMVAPPTIRTPPFTCCCCCCCYWPPAGPIISSLSWASKLPLLSFHFSNTTSNPKLWHRATVSRRSRPLLAMRARSSSASGEPLLPLPLPLPPLPLLLPGPGPLYLSMLHVVATPESPSLRSKSEAI
jgi:hypothetical protein